MKFSELCKFCEEMRSSSVKQRKSVLRNFVECCRRNAAAGGDGVSVFSIFRLLLPSLDRSRGAYGVKEAKLADLYIKVFCISESSDANLLKNYKAPQTTQTSSKDFADVVYNVMKRRTSEKPSDLTISQINDVLDDLANVESTKKTEAMVGILQPILRKMPAVEQKWLIRIIVKDLKLTGAGQKPLLNAYHPDAQDLYDVSNDLEKVCVSLFDASDRSFGITIALFTPFSPMLADRSNIPKIMSKMGNKPFYVETKLDGERTQIHKDGNRYAYYTRRGHDFSPNYGSDPSSGTLTPRLHSCFREEVTNCILDGEMVVWNTEGSFIISKGENTDVKSMLPSGTKIPCFFAFDILLLNDRVLTNVPFKERLQLLESAVKVSEGALNFPERVLVSTKAKVTELLNQAIDRREEGIVLKDPDSIYKPNARKSGWLKVKPEYVTGMMDHLDLLIIGGFRGHGRRRDLISMFLVGVAIPSPDPTQHPREFWSLARVGSGYSDEQLLELIKRFQPHWKKYDKNSPPPNIHYGRDKPDVWIEPSQSVILEVKASEIVVSDMYKVGLTLRFPRVEKIRRDRPWYSAMSLNEVKELRANASGKLVTRHVQHHDDEPAAKRARASTGPILSADCRLADLTDVSRTSDCFAGKEICVMNGDYVLTKEDLTKRIAAAGGDMVLNPTKTTFCVVAAKQDISVKSLKQWDVVRPTWVLRCLAADKLLPYRPQEMFFITKATALEIEKHYDQYGNSLTEFTTAEEVPSILKRVEELVNPRPMSHREIAEVEFDIFGRTLKYSIFRICTIYVDIWEELSNPKSPVLSGELEIIALDLKMYGGLVVDRMDESVSHIVCHPTKNLHRVKGWKARNHLREVKFHLVELSWVTDSIAQGHLADERFYMPMTDPHPV